MSTTVKLDSKGRISIPKQLREQIGLEPGATMFLEYDYDSDTFELKRAVNPFDVLAQEALREYQAGETIPLRKIAEEAGIDLDDEWEPLREYKAGETRSLDEIMEELGVDPEDDEVG